MGLLGGAFSTLFSVMLPLKRDLYVFTLGSRQLLAGLRGPSIITDWTGAWFLCMDDVEEEEVLVVAEEKEADMAGGLSCKPGAIGHPSTSCKFHVVSWLRMEGMHVCVGQSSSSQSGSPSSALRGSSRSSSYEGGSRNGGSVWKNTFSGVARTTS